MPFDSSPLFPLLGVLAAITTGAAVCVIVERWRERRIKAVLKQWASAEGCRLIHWQRAASLGPFRWSMAGYPVVQLVFETRDGSRMRGWARCGGGMVGLWSKQVIVRFDAPTSARGFPVVLKRLQGAEGWESSNDDTN